MNPYNASTKSEFNPNNRIMRRKIFLLAFVILVGGLLLPMGVIRAAAEMREVVYPHATGGAGLIQKTGDYHSHKTNDKGSGGFSQVTTGTVESVELIASVGDLAITKTQLTEFNVGSSGGTFEINIKNISTDTYTGAISVKDDFSLGRLTPTNVSSYDPQLESCSISGNSVKCVYTTPVVLSPGQSLNPIQIDVDVAELAFPEVSNIAELIASDFYTNNNKSAITVKIQSADLDIDKEVSNAKPKAGETIIYTVTVKNNGPDATTNVDINDTLPTQINYLGDLPSNGQGNYFPSSGRWYVGNLANGDFETLIITAQVDQGTEVETITNTAEVFISDRFDPYDWNDSDSALITVQGTDLHVKKTDNYKYIYPGFVFTYTLAISNSGDISATGVTITDVLGSDYTYISDSDSLKLTEDLTDTYVSTNTYTILPNKQITFDMKVKVNDTVDVPIDLTNIITATSKEEKTVTENNADEDTNILADFDLEKIVSPTSANTGGTLRFSIIVKNTGQSELKNK